ncbi:hypothetical protein QYF36_007749 [Acer negundo]|nr:hypothetical protein QYF36_007749 [Acer negundo]
MPCILQNGSWTLEHAKLKARVEAYYMGEELYSLSLKELQSLEQQFDSALKYINRTRKNQLMFESISDLQKKEKTVTQHAQWEQQNHDLNSSSILLVQPPQSLNNSSTYQMARSSGGDDDGTPLGCFATLMNKRSNTHLLTMYATFYA